MRVVAKIPSSVSYSCKCPFQC